MARPRSLLGLCAYLVVLVLRRRPAAVAIVVGALVGLVLVVRGRTTPDAAEVRAKVPPLQPAVLRDGFAVLEGGEGRHVVELDPSGVRRRRSAIPTVTDTRVIGMSVGAGVAFVQGKKIHLAKIEGDGTLGRAQTFGVSVRTMCYGLASNDQRWAVGWLEDKDDRFWFVHGPTQKAGAGAVEGMAVGMSSPDGDATTAPITWCAVASANEYVALIYRLDAKVFVNMCSKKECANFQTRAPVDPRDEVHAIACQMDGCVFALRTREGAAHLVAFDLRGKTTWTKKLAHATPDSRLQLAAAGDRAYLLSLDTHEGPVVERILAKTGSTARAWHGVPALTPPAVTWSAGHALLAYWDGDALGTEVLAMPR